MQVYVVVGYIDYEGTEIIGIADSERIAKTMLENYKNSDKFQYDEYDITEHSVLTGINLILDIQEL
jgi:hypothetical protein